MVIETRNIEWLNLNGQRAYPLAENTSSFDISNSVKLPDDFIVDLAWTVNVVGEIDTTKFHVYSVLTFSTGIIIEFAYDGQPIGTTTINRLSFTENSSYHIVCSGVFADSRGIVTIGSLFTANDTISGEAQFNLSGAGIVPTAIKRALKCVSGLYIRTSDAISNLYQGDVVLKSGANVTLSTDTVADVTTITLNAIPGEGNIPAPLDECGNPLNPLLTINGILPDAEGNFLFEGEICIKFDDTEGAVTMDNSCSTPCCSCDDLAVINNELGLTRAVIDEINIESGRLAAEIQAIAINLVGSKTDGIPTDVQRMVAIMQALLANADVSADCVPACPVIVPGALLVNENDDFLVNEDDDFLEI